MFPLIVSTIIIKMCRPFMILLCFMHINIYFQIECENVSCFTITCMFFLWKICFDVGKHYEQLRKKRFYIFSVSNPISLRPQICRNHCGLGFKPDFAAKFVKGTRTETIKDILSRYTVNEGHIIVKVQGSGTSTASPDNNNNRLNKHGECQIDMPIEVAYAFGVRFLDVYTSDGTTFHKPSTNPDNTFSVLMTMSRNHLKLPDKRYIFKL